ncbi:hypothetical protein BJX99DRAFT_243936 [Aspergillus californicus]
MAFHALAKPGNNRNRCTVGEDSYAAVGRTRITNLPDSISGLSIIKAVNESMSSITRSTSDSNTQTNSHEPIPFESVYYIGAPTFLDLQGSISGCAVIFSDPPVPAFKGGADAVEISPRSGDCSDVIQQSCTDRLTERARLVDYTSSDASAHANSSCSPLVKALTSDPPSECADFAGVGNGLGSFTVASLSDLTVIGKSQSSSSDCWPVSPKGGHLAVFAREMGLDAYTNDGNITGIYSPTPILSVFTASDNIKSKVTKASAQLTCVQVAGTEHYERMNGTEEDTAAVSVVSVLTVGSAVVMTVLFMIL